VQREVRCKLDALEADSDTYVAINWTCNGTVSEFVYFRCSGTLTSPVVGPPKRRVRVTVACSAWNAPGPVDRRDDSNSKNAPP